MPKMLKVQLPDINPKLNIKDKILTVGSCFSAHMYEKLIANKINAISHPFGTLYHPISIQKALYPKEKMEVSDIVESNEIWFHWDTHSTIWGNTTQELSIGYKSAVENTKTALKSSNWLIITLGSAFLYHLKSTGESVANCHKVSQNLFNKKLSSEQELHENIQELIIRLKKEYPQLQILMTVSPVRHYRDGLVENNVSKGRLLSVCYEICSHFDHVHYFPAYEIVIDELRDYRYFKSDNVHPSEDAVEIIWEHLQNSWMDSDLQDFICKWAKIRRAIQHRPLYPGSKSHLRFLNQTILELEALQSIRDFSQEILSLKTELNKYQ